MAKAKNTSSDNAAVNNSSAAKISESITSTLSTADSSAVQSMQALTLVHQARLSQLSRTAAALKAQYGASDAGVKSAQAAVAASTSTIARLSVLQQEVNTPAPQLTAKGFALQGRVYDASLKPLPNMTVFLVDATNTYQQQFGFAYTDETGYFLINAADSEAANAQPVFLQVADNKSRPVYLSPSSLALAAGATLYEKIVISAGGKPIGDPPKAIRGTALPTKASKK
jgi:hypothetical protein